MSYRIIGIPKRITIEEHPEGKCSLGHAIALAKLLAGWGEGTSLAEVPDHEQSRLLRGLGLRP